MTDTAIPAKLAYREGELTGPNVFHNNPWPCGNGNPGSMSVPRGIHGVVMHTMVGDLPATVAWSPGGYKPGSLPYHIAEFNNDSAEASAHFGIDEMGNIHQFGPVNGWMAWAQENGNPFWYSIEHADNGDPANPLTLAQINASAQVVECLARPEVGNFPLQVTDSIAGYGYGVHNMGGAAWGGHSCPQTLNGTGPRAGQRATIIAIARAIRTGAPASPFPMKEGDTGPNIVQLQQMLNKWQPAIGGYPVLATDGQFGPLVRDGVIRAQEHFHQRGVTAGIVTMAVWEALHNAPH